MKQIEIDYDAKNNTLYIGASKKDFVPKYLDYMLEYLKIPKDAKRIFKDDVTEQTPVCDWCKDTVNFHAYNNVFGKMPKHCPECGRKMTKE